MNPEQENNFEKLAEGDEKKTESDKLDRNERQEIKNEAEIIEEERKLQIFSDAIGDAEYYIGGGIGIELMEGKVKHRHGDIDIIVFEDEIDKIKENLRSNGFMITPGRGWGGHSLDARNFEIDEESDEPPKEGDVHVGIFIYKKDKRRGIVRQMEPDGSINKEFPLKYFNKDRQTLNYKQSNLIIADLRLIISLKMISERAKDIKDIERIKPLLKAKYREQEVEEMKDVCKDNLKTRSIASLKHMFDGFLEKGKEITGDNIYDDFIQEIEKNKNGAVDKNYKAAIMSFMEMLKDFSVSAKGKAKKEFSEFVESNIRIISEAQNNLVDKTLD